MDITTVISIIVHSIYGEHCNESYGITTEQLEEIDREITVLVGRKIDMSSTQLSELGSVLSGLSKEEILDCIDEHEETVTNFIKLGLSPKL